LTATVLAFTTAAILAGVFIGCTSDGPTSPTPTTQAPPPPVAAAPAPAPAPTPGLVDPTAAPGFELACLGGSTLTVKNTGGVVAAIETFYTSFDNQDLAFGLQKHTVQNGDTVTRTFPDVCIQGDADAPGSKLIGGCFYDIKGNPFVPSRSPEKVKECRDRCVEKWVEAEPTYSEWEDVIEETDLSESTQTPKCYKSQRRKVTVYEQNSCTQATRTIREDWEYRKVEIQCPCVPEWKKWEDYNDQYPRYTAWGECVRGERTRYRIYYEQNTCNKEIKELERKKETEKCEEPCSAPTLGTFTFDKPLGNEKDECKKFGDYEPTCKTDAPKDDGEFGAEGGIDSCPKSGTTFYLSKCGQATYVLGASYAPACPDGQGLGLSHTTGCVCKK
jgi:hypothetical protein